ncbi:hypothetical protein TI04_02630 [Achromatium sp. WMS2]|nr:hypothetical protein TI04_02630 [Achromatium sp. WMS2]
MSAVPKRRKKRSYISSILSKNEVFRDGPYNRQLFLRISRVKYIINPKVAVRIAGEWHNIYDLLLAQRLGIPSNMSIPNIQSVILPQNS